MNDLRGSVDICKWHCTYNFKAGYCQCRFPSLAQDMRLSVQLQLKLIVVSSEHIDLHDEIAIAADRQSVIFLDMQSLDTCVLWVSYIEFVTTFDKLQWLRGLLIGG